MNTRTDERTDSDIGRQIDTNGQTCAGVDGNCLQRRRRFDGEDDKI